MSGVWCSVEITVCIVHKYGKRGYIRLPCKTKHVHTCLNNERKERYYKISKVISNRSKQRKKPNLKREKKVIILYKIHEKKTNFRFNLKTFSEVFLLFFMLYRHFTYCILDTWFSLLHSSVTLRGPPMDSEMDTTRDSCL